MFINVTVGGFLKRDDNLKKMALRYSNLGEKEIKKLGYFDRFSYEAVTHGVIDALFSEDARLDKMGLIKKIRQASDQVSPGLGIYNLGLREARIVITDLINEEYIVTDDNWKFSRGDF